MSEEPIVGVLRVDDAGNVTAANRAAHALLGDCVGKTCFEVLHACTRDGNAVCDPSCAGRVARGAERAHEAMPVVVGGTVGRLTCTRVGDETLVIVQDTGRPAEIFPKVLSTREREVLGLVAKGLPNREVARVLGISASTVGTHLEHVHQKLGVSTRAEAVSAAKDLGELD